jgi:sugar/nucleoside kinase (ribokinase family)
LDLIFAGLPKLPELGVEIVASDFAMTPGGAYISAVTMHRLGLRVAWAADFGSDEFSQMVLSHARQEGLDQSFFVIHDRPLRYVTTAISYPHERAFIAYYDPAPQHSAGFRAITSTSASVEMVYLCGLYHGPAFKAGQTLIKAKNMKLAMDGNSPDLVTFQNPEVQEVISSLDIFMPNVQEVQRLTGEVDINTGISKLTALCPLVVLKQGPLGATAYSQGKSIHSPSIPVHPVDTTGAGDCFNAAFLKAMFMGLSLEECLAWGNVAGGLSTESLGGASRMICEEDIRKLISQGKG